MVLSLHKQPFVTAHFQFITAHFVRHCALKNALFDRLNTRAHGGQVWLRCWTIARSRHHRQIAQKSIDDVPHKSAELSAAAQTRR